ncbi:hypothetical protein [Salmonirosea aquatica]|uniref:Uncharacterized protein n=1 Tax=Salmonirosea aquatica TaxID=2654236 RepID=A0A7C9BJI0_9BACT|nr:hypothetical protein [Cytophagaceae bacterium SJW1-29]
MAGNPNAFKIKIVKNINKFQSKFTYGTHIIAKSLWFDNLKGAVDNFYPFIAALQSEMGLNQIRVEG